MSLQKSVAEAKTVVYGDPSEQAAASYQLMGSIRLKQGRTQQALKWLTKVTPSFNLCSSLFIGALGLVTIINLPVFQTFPDIIAMDIVFLII